MKPDKSEKIKMTWIRLPIIHSSPREAAYDFYKIKWNQNRRTNPKKWSWTKKAIARWHKKLDTFVEMQYLEKNQWPRSKNQKNEKAWQR